MKDRILCRIRTITVFLTLARDRNSWKERIAEASGLCADLSDRFREHGYTVQSVRIVTNPFGEYLDTSSLEAARRDLAFLADLLQEADRTGIRIRFAVGEAVSHRELELLPELVREFGDLCNVCVNVGRAASGVLDNALILDAAAAVVEIGRITPRGEGNFNFTVNFNCPPLIPYFPAGYHRSEMADCFVIGLETPDLLVEVLKQCNSELGDSSDHNDRYRRYHEAMTTGLQRHIDAISAIIDQTDTSLFPCAGFDSSAAPSKNCASMAEVYELMGVEYFGASGSVEASSLLTSVFQSLTGVNLVGFSGLMLALTEDRGLARGTVEGQFDIRTLLTNSAVCGIGLDTVPIPGDTPVDKIAALMRDTGTLAFRLNKPLTVRLFPVPGLRAGDMTVFESDDLCNCRILAVP